MATKQNLPASESKSETRTRRAYTAMTEVRNALYRRYVDYILANEHRIRDEISGEDSYSFTLQQLDEQFLNKLNIVERAVAELTRSEFREGQTTTTTYETVEVIARRDELPQKVADALAEHGNSDFLDLSVLRADDKMAEVLLVLAREEAGPAPQNVPAERKKQDEQGGDENLGGNSDS